MTSPYDRSDKPWGDGPIDLESKLRIARVIAFALIFGQVVFAAIIQFVDIVPPNEELETLFTAGAAIGVFLIPVAWFARHQIWSRARREREGHNVQRAMASVHTGIVVYYVVLESGALLNLVCWMLKGTQIPNLPVAAILLGLQILGFPRREHFQPHESY